MNSLRTRARASTLALALISGFVMTFGAAPSQAQISIDVQVRTPPPPLPVYVQPPLPGPDYIWTPGYWAWNGDFGDYYWVPGTWVQAPRPGYLWTPGYWGWSDGLYVFHAGYWGEHIGYYGGVAYGFGYTGAGFEGGYWNGPHYSYNRAVTNVRNVNVTNVYNKTVIVNRTTVNNVSFNGGPGGVVARPTPQQLAVTRESHIQATPMQVRHVQAAQSNRALFASANRGAPPVAATARPAELAGPSVVRGQRPPNAPRVAMTDPIRQPARPENARPVRAQAELGGPREGLGSRAEPGVRPEAFRGQPALAFKAHGPPAAARAQPPRPPQSHPAPRPPASGHQPPRPHPEHGDGHRHEG